MKKLHSLAFYTMVTPVIALSSGAVFAEQPTGQDVDREHQSTEYDRDDKRTLSGTDQKDKSKQHEGMSDSRTETDRHAMGDQSRQENRGYISSAPANGLQASTLIGAEVTTSGNEEVGSVSDLIIGDDGKVMAIVVGVGGFLGMGEKDVAIGWDDVTVSGQAEEQELRIDASRDELRSAPEFEQQD